jgi:flagellar biosynthesis GTPase FlhF
VLDATVIAAGISGLGALITISGTTFATIRSGKDKQDRIADRTVQEKTAEKLDAEKDNIVDQTRSLLLSDIRVELERTKRQAEDARSAAEKYRNEARELRDSLVEKNERIDAQTRLIRRLSERSEMLTRRAEALEEWIDANRDRFAQLGIEPLPFDALHDRDRQETKPAEERPGPTEEQPGPTEQQPP